jgi:alkanesulfonate monooxygenase SsuD/methylene tetrahydromethanopterin reductase-like flavin-dependent oxidoreductase (luciferase family)
MRIGIVTIPQATNAPVVPRVLDIARRVEALGFAGLWVTDAFARGRATLDPLVLLGALASVTQTIELGTCVVQIPLRHPVEHAQRVQTLHALSQGRLRFGVGSGSTQADFDAVDVDYTRRFKILPAYLETMRRVYNAETTLSV